MQTDDIAAWLTAIYDERQAACREAQEAVETHSALAAEGTLELRWMLQLRKGGVFQGGWDMPGPPTPTEDLARIAADRQILDQYRQAVKDCACLDTTRTMEIGVVAVLAERRALERVVRRLASAYATRPGYNEEWRP